MIRSMTGFGRTFVEMAGKSVTVEIRTLNSKQLDLNVCLAPLFRNKENEIRTMKNIKKHTYKYITECVIFGGYRRKEPKQKIAFKEYKINIENNYV